MSYVDALPVGAEVGQYAIESVLGQGGFGIVYRARHPVFGRVALKEFFPKSQASRIADGTIVPSTPRSQEAFSKGVERLMAEGAKLKAFKHRNIVKVIDVFEQNHTAYLAMEEVDGMTLQAAVEGRNVISGKAMVEDFAAQMIDALKLVHTSGLVHRDVAPDNILVDFKSGSARFVLIDFGGAKRVVTDVSESSSRSLTKTGFSSPEQYGSESVGGIKATPATDVYGLAATLYWLISGKKPIDAPNRAMQDTQPRLSANPALIATYGKPFLSAVDNGLTLRPDGRPQSAEAFQATLKRGAKEKAETGNWKKPVGVVAVLALLGAGVYASGPNLNGAADPTVQAEQDAQARADAAAAKARADADAAAAQAIADAEADAAEVIADAEAVAAQAKADAEAAEAKRLAVQKQLDELNAQNVAEAEEPECHTVLELQEQCETSTRSERICTEEEVSESLFDDGINDLYTWYPSKYAANNACEAYEKKRVMKEMNSECDGKLRNVEVECNCDWDSSSAAGASCSYEVSADCEMVEEVCETRDVPDRTCRTVNVPREVCE